MTSSGSDSNSCVDAFLYFVLCGCELGWGFDDSVDVGSGTRLWPIIKEILGAVLVCVCWEMEIRKWEKCGAVRCWGWPRVKHKQSDTERCEKC